MIDDDRWKRHVKTSGTKLWKSFSPTYPLVQDMSNFRENGCSTLRKAEDLMPRDIMSSEPRHWMVFGQLPCLSTALHRHDQLAKYHPVPWLRWYNVSWHQVFRLPEGVHDGFLDSRYGPEFTMGSWIHDGFLDSSLDSTSPLCTGPRVR